MADKDIHISSSELKSILDVNTKSIQIYLAVQEQYEDVSDELTNISEKLEKLDGIGDKLKSIDDINEKLKDLNDINNKIIIINDYINNTLKSKIEEIDKNIFRLLVVLGGTGLGTIVAIIKSFIH